LTILDADRKVVWYQRYPRAPGNIEAIPVAFAGRYVGLQLPHDRTGWYDISGEEELERRVRQVRLDVPPVPDAARRRAAFDQRDSDAAVEALCRRFYAAVDPNVKGLEGFRKLYGQGAYRQALNAYRDYFFSKLAHPGEHGVPATFGEGPRVVKGLIADPVAVKAAMQGRRVKMLADCVLVGDVGQPGVVRWTPPVPVSGTTLAVQKDKLELPAEAVDFYTTLHGPLFAAFDDLLFAYAVTGDAKQLRQWLDYLDDWCLYGREDLFNSPLNLTMSTELATGGLLEQFFRLRFIAVHRPEIQRDFRATSLVRYLLAGIEDLPPYVIRARRAELANWGCMGTKALADLSMFLPEYKAMQNFAREAVRLAMSSFLQQRTLDGENIEAWDDGHRSADAGMMEVFDLLPQMPLPLPKADALQMRYLRDLKNTFYRNVLTHVSPGGYYWFFWLSDKAQRNVWRAMNYVDARQWLVSNYLSGEEYQWLSANEPEAAARGAVLNNQRQAVKPSRFSDMEPYAGMYFLRDDWQEDAEYFLLHSFRARSQDGEFRPVEKKNTFNGVGSMRYDLMKEGRSLLTAEGIVIDKKPSNRWHDAIQTGGKTAYCAMAERHVVPTRFHTSARFDLAEAVRNDPYSRPAYARPSDWYGIWDRQPEIDNTPIKEVTACRQVFHVRGEGVWIVADRMENPHPQAFDYAQFWTFPALVKPEGYRKEIERLHAAGHRLIEEDAPNQRIRTANPGYANLSTYFFGHVFEMVQEIDSRGHYRPVAGAKSQVDIIHAAGDTAPQFNHSLRKSGIRWQGQGNQVLVTLHYTRAPLADVSRQFENDLREIQEVKGARGATGFRAVTRSGAVVGFQSGPEKANSLKAGAACARAESLLVVEKDNALSGLALGTDKTITLRGRVYTTETADFEYALAADGRFTATPIQRAIDTVKISPEQNVFTDSLKVSFAIPTQDTRDIDFRYTLDGSDPTLQAPLYTGPFVIGQDTYVKVRPFRKGLTTTPFNIPGETAGKTVGAIFRKERARPAILAPVLKSGLAYEYYEGPWPALFTHVGVRGVLEPKCRGQVAGLLNPGEVESIRATDRAYDIRYEGCVRIPVTGVYSFHAPRHLYTPTMDAGYDLRVWVDGEEWFPSPTLHSENIWHIALEAGLHRLDVTYVDYRWKTFKNEYWMSWQEGEMWQGTPVLEISGPGFEKQPMPAAWLSHAE
jgi:hypothetical protein